MRQPSQDDGLDTSSTISAEAKKVFDEISIPPLAGEAVEQKATASFAVPFVAREPVVRNWSPFRVVRAVPCMHSMQLR